MPNHNSCNFIGHIGQDAVRKQSKSGDQSWTEFSLAVKDRNNETIWITCRVFGRAADNAANFCKKGAAVFVSGRISIGAYLSKDGQPKPNISLSCSEWQILSKVDTNTNPQTNVHASPSEPIPSVFDDLPF